MNKVLLLADNAAVLESHKNILSNRGLQIFSASRIEEAMEMHSREKVDLIICCLKITDTPCKDLCKNIRRHDVLKNVSIIVLLPPAGSYEDVDFCLRSGTNDYLKEPEEPYELIQKVLKYVNIATRLDTRLEVKMKVEGRIQKEVFAGLALNVSVSGMLLESEHRFSVNQKIPFSVIIPETGSVLTVTGQIVRIGLSRFLDNTLYGVLFVDMSDDLKKGLQDYINTLSGLIVPAH